MDYGIKWNGPGIKLSGLLSGAKYCQSSICFVTPTFWSACYGQQRAAVGSPLGLGLPERAHRYVI